MNTTTYTTTGLTATIIETAKKTFRVVIVDTDANETAGYKEFKTSDKADEYARACIQHAA